MRINSLYRRRMPEDAVRKSVKFANEKALHEHIKGLLKSNGIPFRYEVGAGSYMAKDLIADFIVAGRWFLECKADNRGPSICRAMGQILYARSYTNYDPVLLSASDAMPTERWCYLFHKNYVPVLTEETLISHLLCKLNSTTNSQLLAHQ